MTLTECVIILKRLQWSETSIDKLGKLEFCIKQIVQEQNKRRKTHDS